MPHRPRGPRRLAQLVAIAAVLAAAVGTVACSGKDEPAIAAGPTPTSASQVPYDPAFAFKQRIPTGPSLDPRSAAIVRQLDQNHVAGQVFLPSRNEVPPVYVVHPSDPFYSVGVDGETVRFRVPPGARAGDGADRPLVLLDPNHPDFGRHTELRLFQARIDHAARRIDANGSGLFHYNNDRARPNPDGSRSMSVPFSGHGTGSGLSNLAGLIRPAEVRAGRIRHALRFAYSARDFSSRFRPPAIRSDQPNDTTTRNPATAMDMGMRLQLDPSVDCAARTVPGKADGSRETRFLRMICRALQEYGMIAVDGTDERALVLMMEHNRTAGWEAIVGEERFGGYSHLIRNRQSREDGLYRGETAGIPWDRFRVLKRSPFPADR